MMSLRMLGLLMLMLLQCDADERCGYLDVTPSEVIAEFGSTISLNCSNVDDDHYGITLSAGTITNTTTEDASVELHLNLSDWNVRPHCEMKVGENSTCEKDVDITVYRNPDSIFMFSIHDAVDMGEGTQHQLQCDITDVAPVQNLMVRWYKDDEMIHEEHFTNTTKTPVSESHILTVNISRKDTGARFNCTAQLDFGPDGPKPPAVSDAHSVSVRYPPTLNSEPLQVLNMEQGDNVTLNCDAEGKPNPTFHWVQDGVNMTEDTNSLSVNPEHAYSIYTCTATNYLGRITKEFHVNVTNAVAPTDVAAMPEKKLPEPQGCPLTVTPAKLVVKLGEPASANCSTSAANPARLGWEAPKGGDGSGNITSIKWTVDKVEFWNTVPVCYMTTSNNDQCSERLDMTVYNTPVIITEFPSGVVEEGEERLLKCNFINVIPVQNLTVKWYKGNDTIQTDRFDDVSVKQVNVSSNLTLVHERGDNGGKISCRAELHLGPNGPNPVPTVTSEPYIADVNYEPQVKSCPTHYSGKEHNFTLDMLPCEADGNPPPKVQWYHQGELVDLSQPLTRNHSGIYKVEFSNYLGNASADVDITIEYEPTFACDGLYKVRENDKFQTSCKPVGNPVPIVTWFKDGKVVNQQHWTKNDGGKYVLEANNTHGVARQEVEVDVMYEPQVRSCPTHYLGKEHNFTLDMLACKADGKPPPKVQWYLQGKLVNLSQPLTRSHSGRYKVEFSNNLGTTSAYVDINVGYGPSFPCGDSYEVKENDKLQTCKPVGYPVPTVTWFKDGKEVNQPKHWSRHDSGKYVLKANNTYGMANLEVQVRVVYPAKIIDYTSQEVIPGSNVTLKCSAEGNPTPKIQWKYIHADNVEDATRGGSGTVSITRATSVNAGGYTCIATNKFGEDSKEVTLTMRGDTSGRPAFLWWLIIVLLILIIIFLIWLYCHRQKKLGRYSFVPDKSKEDIPMTTTSNGTNVA